MPGLSVAMPCYFVPPGGQDAVNIYWLINAKRGVEPTDIAINLSYIGRVKYYWDPTINYY